MTDDNDYEIGYGKPPRSTRFKPGQSGNPKGRPKKVKDPDSLDKILDNELSQPIRFSDGGESRTAPRRVVFVKSIVNDALKGDRAARKLVFNHMQSNKTIEGFEPDAADHQALADLVEKAKREGLDVEESGDD